MKNNKVSIIGGGASGIFCAIMLKKLNKQLTKSYEAIFDLIQIFRKLELSNTKLAMLYDDYMDNLSQAKILLNQKSLNEQDIIKLDQLDNRLMSISEDINKETKPFWELEEVRKVITPLITLFSQSQQNDNQK